MNMINKKRPQGERPPRDAAGGSTDEVESTSEMWSAGSGEGGQNPLWVVNLGLTSKERKEKKEEDKP